MRINKELYAIALARACMTPSDVMNKAGIPRGTYCGAVGKRGGSPVTIGKIAKAIGVDVTEIIDTQEVQL